MLAAHRSFIRLFVRSFRFLWSTMTICRCFMFARHIFRSAFFHTTSYCVVLATTLKMRHVHIHTTSAIRDGRLWIIQKNKEKKHRIILVIIDINLELHSLCSTPSEQRAAAAAATTSSSSFRIMASQKCFRNAWICQCGKLTYVHHPWICWTF